MQYISYTVTNTHYEFQQTSSWQNSDEDNSIKEKSFLKFYEERALNEHNLRQSTRFCHLSTLKHLARFAPDLQFKDLTYQFLIDFENYLLSIPLHKNTIAKHMKQLKRYLNSAIGQGLIDIRYHPFLNYKIQMEDTLKAYLTPEELNSIEQLPLHSCHGLSRCRDIFLFSCYTGLRFSDIVRLSKKDIQKIDNIWWLTFPTQKTEIIVRLPLSLLSEGKALPIIRKYKFNKNETLFNLSKNSNSNINKLLKTLAHMAHIDKKISFHTARHTFATLLLYKGAQITTVQRLLGHKSIRTTEIYSAIMDMTVIRDLKTVKKTNKTKNKISQLNKTVNQF